MRNDEVLTNHFEVRYDEADEIMRIFTVKDGTKSKFPIELRLATLSEMGPADASKWVGETILLLVPAMRTKLFGLK